MPVTTTERGWKASVTRPVEWTAEVLPGLLDTTPDDVPDLFGDRKASPKRVLVVDTEVMNRHGDAILNLLARFDIEHPLPVIVPGGEAAKTRITANRITEAMEKFNVPRFGEPVLVWGGGVAHDVAGLAASQFRRGVPYRFYATTLVAAIDAGFALKVAVSQGWKNRVGAYHPAEAMFTDSGLFPHDRERTLDGTGEVLKWFCVDPDPTHFDHFEAHGPRVVQEHFRPDDPEALTIIRRTIAGMMRELAANPFEANSLRRSYVGHGMSPAFEPLVSHGQAVILDILLSLMIATRRDLIRASLRDRIVRVIRDTGLALWHDVLDDGPGPIMDALADTSRHRHGRMSIPVPYRRLGRVTYMQDISAAEVDTALHDLQGISKA
jgi:2-epi-5-epi-valiolone synthase